METVVDRTSLRGEAKARGDAERTAAAKANIETAIANRSRRTEEEGDRGFPWGAGLEDGYLEVSNIGLSEAQALALVRCLALIHICSSASWIEESKRRLGRQDQEDIDAVMLSRHKYKAEYRK